MMGNPYSAYKKQAVTTMTPIEIVVKLYDECERQMNRAVHFIENKNYAETNNALTKSIEIIEALRSVLDMELQMGKNLDSLYEYFIHELVEINMKKNAEKLRVLIPQVGELKDAFAQISRMPKNEINLQAMHSGEAAI